MNRYQKDGKDAEHQTLKHMVDRVIDYVSSSRSTLQMLSNGNAIPDEHKALAAKQNAKELIRRKLLKDFLKNGKNEGHQLTQLHVNECFKDRTDPNVKCYATFNDNQFETRNEAARQKRTSMNFLDEQYNLTKQAIARRYRPQMRINSISTKNTLMRDYFDEPYDQDYHRIANVLSERIPVYQLKKKHSSKVEKIIIPGTATKPSNKKTRIIYEKY